MKQIIFSLLFVGLISGFTQPTSVKYPMVIKFQSICCGVPDDAPLKEMIRKFKKQYKIKTLKATHIGPMGKEGEYYLAFSLRELSKKQAKLFVNGIKNINKHPDDPGILTINESMEINTAEIPRRATIKKISF